MIERNEDSFRFSEDERDTLVLPSLSKNPIADEESFDAFADRLEPLIDRYLQHEHWESPTVLRKRYEKAQRLIRDLLELLRQGELMRDLRLAFMLDQSYTVPDRKLLLDSLESVDALMTLRVSQLEGRRLPRVPQKLQGFVMLIGLHFYDHFRQLPSKVASKGPGAVSEDSAFIHILKHVFISMGEEPHDLKNLATLAADNIEQQISVFGSIEKVLHLTDLLENQIGLQDVHDAFEDVTPR